MTVTHTLNHVDYINVIATIALKHYTLGFVNQSIFWNYSTLGYSKSERMALLWKHLYRSDAPLTAWRCWTQ